MLFILRSRAIYSVRFDRLKDTFFCIGKRKENMDDRGPTHMETSEESTLSVGEIAALIDNLKHVDTEV